MRSWLSGLACLLLSGCADYLNHRDTITFGAGNAMEANKAIHIINPLNPQSYNTRIYADGRRTARVMSTYTGTAIGPVKSSGGATADKSPKPYEGNCEFDDDIAADGSRCGPRSAESRAGGHEPNGG